MDQRVQPRLLPRRGCQAQHAPVDRNDGGAQLPARRVPPLPQQEPSGRERYEVLLEPHLRPQEPHTIKLRNRDKGDPNPLFRLLLPLLSHLRPEIDSASAPFEALGHLQRLCEDLYRQPPPQHQPLAHRTAVYDVQEVLAQGSSKRQEGQKGNACAH